MVCVNVTVLALFFVFVFVFVFIFVFETGSHCVALTGLELTDLLASAS